MKSKKTKISLLFITIIFIITAVYLKSFWLPYYNHYFAAHNYTLPQNKGDDFVVNIEPYSPQANPLSFMRNLVEEAFPEYNVVFNNDLKPHLIIRHNFKPSKDEKHQWDAPYITVSGERYKLKTNRLRSHSIPFAEIVSSTPQNNKEIYIPFLVWYNTITEREFTHNNRERFLAYTASNCIPFREKMFQAIKNQNPNAEALGKCSNPSKKPFPGNWQDLYKKYSEYNFALVMENHKHSGYVTEKIFIAFRAGAIPIYWGDTKTLEEVFNINPKAYINVNNFNNTEEVADFIVKLNNDKDKMAQMRAEPIFKNNQVPDIFFVSTTKENPIIKEGANKIRDLFLQEIKRNS